MPSRFSQQILEPQVDNAVEKMRNNEEVQEENILHAAVLSAEERQVVLKLAAQIDIQNVNQILNYGVHTQQEIADCSNSILHQVQRKDQGEVGTLLSDLVFALKDITFVSTPEQKSFWSRFFQKKEKQIAKTKEQYKKAEKYVEEIAGLLEQHQIILLKDIAVLDHLYDLNSACYKKLTMYIMAGQKKLEYVYTTDLKILQQRAEITGSIEDIQRYDDMVSYCEQFEQKIHDLELSRMISMQMGPQTRLLQNHDAKMVEKIQSSLTNTIPLWKNQMILALGMENANQARKTQAVLSEMTAAALEQHAELLTRGLVDAAQKSNNSIVDFEVLQRTSQQLLTTLSEVIQIQEDSIQQRKETELVLQQIEYELQ